MGLSTKRFGEGPEEIRERGGLVFDSMILSFSIMYYFSHKVIINSYFLN